MNTIKDINQRFGIGPQDSVLALSALSFDLSVYDLFGLLATGGTLVIPDADAAKEPAHWVDMMTQHHVTVWNTVPALMQMLVDYIGERSQRVPNSLRLTMMSGDWIPLSLPERINALWSQAKMISLGGATEASIWSIYYPIETVDSSWKSIPYGQPLTNQTFHVFDSFLEPCPVWVPGELYIGGIGLAQCYWRDQEKTQASFITHPQTQERLYKTGDLGRYLPEGHIEFLGRENFQVKISGYRIELGEIEATLEQHPAIKEAVVTIADKEQRHQSLIAYVVTEETISSSLLSEYLQQKLPEYMIPSTYIQLENLPLTPNGKVDRQALPSFDTTQVEPKKVIAPRTKTEKRLVALVSEVLGIEQVGIYDNFFDLGGDSLLATQLLSRVRDDFQIELPLRHLFEKPTVANLAEPLEGWILAQKIQQSDNKTPLNDEDYVEEEL